MSDELSEKLKVIESKIESIEVMLENLMESEKFFYLFPAKTSRSHEPDRHLETAIGQTVNAQLLKLPDSLRQTMFALDELNEASASEVAKVSGRSRSVESFHLNRLERMGYLVRFRRAKRVYFKISKSMDRKDAL